MIEYGLLDKQPITKNNNNNHNHKYRGSERDKSLLGLKATLH